MKGEIIHLSDYVDHLQTEGQYFFSRIKTIKALNISTTGFKAAVHQLTKKNRIHRVRSDFYIIIPLEYRSTGCLPASWFIDDFMHSLQTKYYVGILSAAALYGAAHQQPTVFQVITNQIIRPIKVGPLRLEFYYKKYIDNTFSDFFKTETGRMKVSTPEMTACDVVRYMKGAGQIHNIATVLSELQEKINIQNLVNYITNGHIEISVIQRLGYVLDDLQTKLDLEVLTTWIKTKNPHQRLLVPGHTAPIIDYNKRWRVLVNEKIEWDTI